MDDCRADQSYARPGVDHVPGCACEQDHWIDYASSSWGEQEVNPADGGEEKADCYEGVEDQVPPSVRVHAASLPGQSIPCPPRHVSHPRPVERQVDNSRDDHCDAAPGMQIIPGCAAEQDLEVIAWITTTLESTRG